MTVSVGIVVWCNGLDRPGWVHICGAMFESSGDTGESARWQAARQGWTERRGLDYCPAHGDVGLDILEPRSEGHWVELEERCFGDMIGKPLTDGHSGAS